LSIFFRGFYFKLLVFVGSVSSALEFQILDRQTDKQNPDIKSFIVCRLRLFDLDRCGVRLCHQCRLDVKFFEFFVFFGSTVFFESSLT
jgi:hypothetical protein